MQNKEFKAGPGPNHRPISPGALYFAADWVLAGADHAGMASPSKRGISKKEVVALSSVAGACALLHLQSSSPTFVTQPVQLQKDFTQGKSLPVLAERYSKTGEAKTFRSGLGTAVAGGSALALLLRHQRRRSTKSQRCHVIRLAAPQNIAPKPEKETKSTESTESQDAFPQIPMPVVAGALATLAVVASNPAMAQEVAGAAADVASAAEDVEEVVGDVAQSSGDWFEPLIQFNAGIIAGIDGVIEDQLNVPNSFGFAIIGYTLLIKVLTYPLNQSALRSGAIMQLIRPKVDQVQRKYKNDQETQNRMLLRLYDDCGVNPLGGCVPSLVQFPIFIGLYRSILKLSQINPRFQEPFLWIPSLAGPSASGPSLDWLIKSQSETEFIPLIGWDEAARYCILPVLLIGSQIITQKVSQPDVGNQGGPAAIISNIVPLVIGYTGLVSPAGLGVYWLCNNLVTQAQTYLIRSQLGEEFPEYKKYLDGSAQREEEEAKKAKEEAVEEEEIAGPGVGFGVDTTDQEEETKAKTEDSEEKVLATEPARPMRRLSTEARPRRRRSRR